MKTKRVLFLIMGSICLGAGILIGIVLGMQKGEQIVITDKKDLEVKVSPNNQVVQISTMNTTPVEEKETQDSNEAFKYTKEYLKRDNEHQRLEDDKESEQFYLEHNKEIKRNYKEAKGNIFLIENSDTEKINSSQIFGVDEELLAMARNEIYARHGYIFSNSIYKEYFGSKDWYIPSKKINEVQLSEVEKYNVKYLEWKEKCIKQGINNLDDERPQREFCDMYRFNVDEPFKMDLNNDGIEEEIVFQSKTKDEWCVSSGYIKINGKASREITGEFQHYIWVVDIDETDNYKEIVINDMGPSSDYEDFYYYYNGRELVFMGQVTGIINGVGSNIRNYAEKGILHGTIRCDIIGTAWYKWDYKLTSEHKLQEIPNDYCETYWRTYTREPITIYESNQLSSKKSKYETGLPMLIVGTDLKEWVKVQLEDGKYGWFNINEFRPDNLDGFSHAD